MNIYLMIMIGLGILNLGYALAKDGQPKEGKHNFGVVLISTIISFGLYYLAFTN